MDKHEQIINQMLLKMNDVAEARGVAHSIAVVELTQLIGELRESIAQIRRQHAEELDALTKQIAELTSSSESEDANQNA